MFRGCDRALDVDRSQQGKDVGLQALDQNFEQEHCHAANERQRAKRLQQAFSLEQQELGTRCSKHDDQVAGEHGGKESEAVRDRADQEGRDDFDQDNQRKDGHRNTGRNSGVLEVLDAVLLDAKDDPGEVHDRCQGICRSNMRGGGQLGQRDAAPQVVQQDKEEEGEQQRDERTEVLLTDDVASDRVADEVVAELAQELQPARNKLPLPRGSNKEPADQGNGQKDKQHLLSKALAVLGAPGKDLREVHFIEGWWNKPLFIGGGKRKRDQRVSSLLCPSLGISLAGACGMHPFTKLCDIASSNPRPAVLHPQAVLA